MNPIDDDTLSKTLARLNAVEIPAGLEQRILANLAAQTTLAPTAAHRAVTDTRAHTGLSPMQPPPAARLSRLWLGRPRMPATLGLSGLAFAALVLTVTHLPPSATHSASTPHPPALAAQPRLSSPRPALASPPTQALSPSRGEVQAADAQAAEALASALASSPPRSSPAARVNTPSDRNDIHRADSHDADTALALAETRAPSQLAPPLPLTEDERTLLQLAKNRSPDAINALDATRRAAQEADEKAAFDAFFTPPTPPHNELSGESE